jgi:hypothetical protein
MKFSKVFIFIIIFIVLATIGGNNVKATGIGFLQILNDGILDDNDYLSIDSDNRQLIYPDGITSALNWSNDGVVLINTSTPSDATTTLQVKSLSGQDFVNLFNDSGNSVLSIKSTGQIVSTTATGTKPLDITSTTLVDNLNADMLDGYHYSDFALPDEVVQYDGGLTMPTIVGQSGKFLTNNGSALSWGTALTAEADTFETVRARGNTTLTPIYVGQINLDYSNTSGTNSIYFGTTTGSRIGTASDQKLAFYNATPITQPANDVPLDTVLTNLGLRASGGTPTINSFKIGTGVADTDYTLTFDGETNDGVISSASSSGGINFVDRVQTSGGVMGKVTTITNDNYYIRGPMTSSEGSDGVFRSGVLLPSGQVVLTPYFANYIGLYNSVANTYVRGPAYSSEGDYAFSGGVLLPSGQVVMIPYNSNYIGLYNSVANTYARGPSIASEANGSRFTGGILLPSGQVVLIPHHADYIGLYDTVANTYARGPSISAEGDFAFFGGVLLPSGKIAMVPRSADYIGLYDPVANTYARGPSISAEGNHVFSGGVLLPSGQVVLIPHRANYIGLYDPVANTYARGPSVAAEEKDAFFGGILLPSGQVVMIPYSADYVGLYDPVANTYARGPSVSAEGNYAFCAGVLLPSGQIAMVPGDADYIGLYDPEGYIIPTSEGTIVGNRGTAFTITLPTATANVVGQIFTISNIGAGVVTLDGAGSDTIDGALTQTINQYGGIKVQCISVNTWVTI